MNGCVVLRYNNELHTEITLFIIVNQPEYKEEKNQLLCARCALVSSMEESVTRWLRTLRTGDNGD